MRVDLVSGPDYDLVTLDELKDYLNLEDADLVIGGTSTLVASRDAALDYCERYCYFPLGSRRWRVSELLPADVVKLSAYASVPEYEGAYAHARATPTPDGHRLYEPPIGGWPAGAAFSINEVPPDPMPPVVRQAVLMTAHDLWEFRGDVPTRNQTAVQKMLGFVHARPYV